MAKNVLGWVGNIVIGCLLVAMVVLVFFTVGSKLSPDGMPKLANYKLMVVLSGSMSPVFEAGDVIFVAGAEKPEGYKKGDVITFKDPEQAERIVTHRIIAVVKEGEKVSYKTKGDANETPDTMLVPSGNVIGQQKWHIPYFGRVVEFAKTKQGLVWLIIVPGIVIILSELKNIGKAISEEVERKKREAVAQPWVEEQKDQI